MGPGKDYYAELEVSATASFEEVRAAYRRLARAHHPDVNPSAQAAERMRRINEAWEVLRDPVRRAEYDRTRPAGAARAFAGPRAGRSGAAAGQGRPRARPTGSARPASRPRPAEPPPQDRPPEPGAGPRIDGSVDWYAFLGVPPGASREAIRKAIASLADELLGSDVSGERLTRQRQRLREAWAILSDARLRAAYDRARAEHLAAEGANAGGPAARDDGRRMPAGYRTGPVAVGGLVLEAGAKLAGADLRGADLRGLDLAGADLSGRSSRGRTWRQHRSGGRTSAARGSTGRTCAGPTSRTRPARGRASGRRTWASRRWRGRYSRGQVLRGRCSKGRLGPA